MYMYMYTLPCISQLLHVHVYHSKENHTSYEKIIYSKCQ